MNWKCTHPQVLQFLRSVPRSPIVTCLKNKPQVKGLQVLHLKANIAIEFNEENVQNLALQYFKNKKGKKSVHTHNKQTKQTKVSVLFYLDTALYLMPTAATLFYLQFETSPSACLLSSAAHDDEETTTPRRTRMIFMAAPLWSVAAASSGDSPESMNRCPEGRSECCHSCISQSWSRLGRGRRADQLRIRLRSPFSSRNEFPFPWDSSPPHLCSHTARYQNFSSFSQKWFFYPLVRKQKDLIKGKYFEFENNSDFNLGIRKNVEIFLFSR